MLDEVLLFLQKVETWVFAESQRLAVDPVDALSDPVAVENFGDDCRNLSK